MSKVEEKLIKAVSERIGELQDDLAIVDTYLESQDETKLSKYAFVKLKTALTASINQLEEFMVENVTWEK